MYDIDDDDVDTGCDDEDYRDQLFLSGRDPGDESDTFCLDDRHCAECVAEGQAYCCDCGALLEPSE